MTVFSKKVSLPALIRQMGLPDTLTDSDMMALLPGSTASRHGIVKRAMAQGTLIQVRRGLYTLGNLYRREKIHAFDLAQRIYGPSYISFESALAAWGLIPEAVYTITNGCSGRSKEFNTPLGHYSYIRIPYGPLYQSVVRKKEGSATYFIATPLRALADYVYNSTKKWDLRGLEKSLRLEEIPRVEREEFNLLAGAYTHARVQYFFRDYDRRMLK